jgi:predicted nucleic acid binding AN1-type Zn finger protein
MKNDAKQKMRTEKRSIAIAIAEIENRVKKAGCTDDCDNCTLEYCARESGVCAIVGELGDIEFHNGTLSIV